MESVFKRLIKFSKDQFLNDLEKYLANYKDLNFLFLTLEITAEF
tara:strand:+ start:5134 stop:5265 length:132 start_codon:yes stop_codon:yes gene_type:complete